MVCTTHRIDSNVAPNPPDGCPIQMLLKDSVNLLDALAVSRNKDHCHLSALVYAVGCLWSELFDPIFSYSMLSIGRRSCQVLISHKEAVFVLVTMQKL